MLEAESRADVVDSEHLRLLAYAYVFSAVMTGLFSLLGLFYAVMGLAMSRVLGAAAQGGARAEQISPELFGSILGLFGLVIFLLAITLAALKLWTARCIRMRRSRMLCMVVAGICCLGIPYGTVLGTCTFLVLGRQSVVSRFDAADSRSGTLP